MGSAAGRLFSPLVTGDVKEKPARPAQCRRGRTQNNDSQQQLLHHQPLRRQRATGPLPQRSAKGGRRSTYWPL